METVNWKVEGMTCSNCALAISKYLQRQGMENVKVNAIAGDVSFDLTTEEKQPEKLAKGIESLGYKVVDKHKHHEHDSHDGHDHSGTHKGMNQFLIYFLICLPFTLVLMLHMFERWFPIHWLMNPWLQLALCIPVYITGMHFFGRSAV